MGLNVICKHCRTSREDGHRHCSACGARFDVGKPKKHASDCPRVQWRPKPGQWCARHRKLLAAGAKCPKCEERPGDVLNEYPDRIKDSK